MAGIIPDIRCVMAGMTTDSNDGHVAIAPDAENGIATIVTAVGIGIITISSGFIVRVP
jgi:hypothetical protein